MLFSSSGISIFTRCLRRLVLMFLRLVSALTFGQKKSAGSHHISSRLSTAPYNLWVEVCAMSAAPIVIRVQCTPSQIWGKGSEKKSNNCKKPRLSLIYSQILPNFCAIATQECHKSPPKPRLNGKNGHSS